MRFSVIGISAIILLCYFWFGSSKYVWPVKNLFQLSAVVQLGVLRSIRQTESK